MAEHVQVLWICGPPGVGKSTVAWAIFTHFREVETPVAYVDIDQLGMCYPEPAADPTRDLMKARNLAAAAETFRAHGAEVLVVSGVIEESWAPTYEGEAALADIRWCRLHLDDDLLRQRLEARGWHAEMVSGSLEYAGAQQRSTFANARIDTTGHSVDEVVRLALDSLPIRPAAHVGSAERPGDRDVSTDTDPVLVLCGPTGVGKSTVGWHVFQRMTRAGVTIAFIDIDQLGFLYQAKEKPTDRHQVQARTASAMWSTFKAAGARALVLNGSIRSDDGVTSYVSCFPNAAQTICQLLAAETELADRIGHRAAHDGPTLAGDALIGLDPKEISVVVAEAVEELSDLAANELVDVRIDTNGLSASAIADLVLASAPGWNSLLSSACQGGRTSSGLVEGGAPLDGGNMNEVVRVADTVRRRQGTWSGGVHQLLRHVQRAGFAGAPQFVGTDSNGREVLTYVAGENGLVTDPQFLWADATLASAGRMLRAFHDAQQGFEAPNDIEWNSIGREPVTVGEVICHNDFAPYNCICSDGRIAAMIDFDLCAPGTRVWDLAWTAINWVPLFDPMDHPRQRPDPPESQRRLYLLVDAYGLKDRDGLIAAIQRRMIHMMRVWRERRTEGDPWATRTESHMPFWHRVAGLVETNAPLWVQSARST